MRNLRQTTVITVALAAMAVGVPAAQPTPASRPNILFIMVDEMRWDVMSCANHPFVKTPHCE